MNTNASERIRTHPNAPQTCPKAFETDFKDEKLPRNCEESKKFITISWTLGIAFSDKTFLFFLRKSIRKCPNFDSQNVRSKHVQKCPKHQKPLYFASHLLLTLSRRSSRRSRRGRGRGKENYSEVPLLGIAINPRSEFLNIVLNRSE